MNKRSIENKRQELPKQMEENTSILPLSLPELSGPGRYEAEAAR